MSCFRGAVPVWLRGSPPCGSVWCVLVLRSPVSCSVVLCCAVLVPLRCAAPPNAPPPRPPGRRTARTHRPTHMGQATQSQAGERRDQAPPPRPRAKKAEHGTGAGNAEGHEPPGPALPAPCTGTARSPRATPTRGGGRVPRGTTGARTRNRHAVRTRRATGPTPENAETAWNGAPAAERRGHQDRTTRNTHCGEREGRGGHEGGGSQSRHRLPPP